MEFDSTCAFGSIFKLIFSYERLKVHNMSSILRTSHMTSSMAIAAVAAAATAAAETATITCKNLEESYDTNE